MKLKLPFLVALIFCSIVVSAQHEYMPQSYDFDMLYSGDLYKKNVDKIPLPLQAFMLISNLPYKTASVEYISAPL